MAQLERVGTLGRGNSQRAQAYSSNKRWLAADSTAGIWIYDANDWAQLPRLIEYTENRLDYLQFSPDDSLLIAACNSLMLCVWQTETGRFLGRFAAGNAGNNDFVRVAISPDFTHIALWQGYAPIYNALFEIHAEAGEFSAQELSLASQSADRYQSYYSSQFMQDGKRLFVIYPQQHESSNAYSLYKGGFLDIETGQPLITPLDALLNAEPFYNATFSSDNRYLVMEYAKSIAIVDAVEAEVKTEIAYLGRHDSTQPAYQLSPDGKFAAVLLRFGGDEPEILYRIIIWNLDENAQQSEIIFKKQSDWWYFLRNFQFTEDGKGLITETSDALPIANLGEQRRVEWGVITGEPRLPTAPAEELPNSLKYQFAGMDRITPNQDNTVALNCFNWDEQSPALVANPVCTTYDTASLYDTDDSGRWFVSLYGGDVLVWDLASGKTIHYIHHSRGMASLQFRPNSTQFITATNAIRVWEGTTGEFLQVFGAVGGFYLKATFNHAGTYLAGAHQQRPRQYLDCVQNRLEMWNTSQYQVTYRLDSYSTPIQFLEDDTVLIAQRVQGTPVADQPCTYAGNLHLLDAITGEIKREFAMDELRYFTSTTLSRDGSLLVGGTSDGWLYVWDFALGELLYQQQVETIPVTGLYFSVDGRMLLTGTRIPQNCSGSDCASGIIKIWGVPIH